MMSNFILNGLKAPFKGIFEIKTGICEINKKLEVNNQVLKDVLWALISECMTDEDINKLALTIKNMH